MPGYAWSMVKSMAIHRVVINARASHGLTMALGSLGLGEGQGGCHFGQVMLGGLWSAELPPAGLTNPATSF